MQWVLLSSRNFELTVCALRIFQTSLALSVVAYAMLARNVVFCPFAFDNNFTEQGKAGSIVNYVLLSK